MKCQILFLMKTGKISSVSRGDNLHEMSNPVFLGK